jgi:hypothetical protein
VVSKAIRDRTILTLYSDDRFVQATRQMLQLAGGHPRLDTAVLQTVGEDWNGFALALVK